MKKFLFLVMAVVLLGTTVTGCKGKKSEADKINDSIAEMMGKMSGYDLKADFQENSQQYDNLDKDEFLKGMLTVINMDTTKNNQSYLAGLQAGMRLYQQLVQSEAQGIKIDRKIFLNEFKKIIESKDSLDMTKLQKEMDDMQNKVTGMKERAMQIKGQENLAAGKNYIDELMKKDDGYKKATSGVIYKIVEQGKGEAFNDTAVIDVKMTVKDLNNNVLINTGKPQPLPMAQVKGHPLFAKLFDLIKGMKPGSKMIAIIPGDLIQTQMMGISPNMTLTCEINTVGIHQEEPRPAPQAYPGRPAPAPGPKPQPAPGQPKPQPRAPK